MVLRTCDEHVAVAIRRDPPIAVRHRPDPALETRLRSPTEALARSWRPVASLAAYPPVDGWNDQGPRLGAGRLTKSKLDLFLGRRETIPAHGCLIPCRRRGCQLRTVGSDQGLVWPNRNRSIAPCATRCCLHGTRAVFDSSRFLPGRTLNGFRGWKVCWQSSVRCFTTSFAGGCRAAFREARDIRPVTAFVASGLPIRSSQSGQRSRDEQYSASDLQKENPRVGP